MSKIGGVPQNIPGGEIYPALEKGTIDATEWVGPYDDEKLGFQQGRQVLLLPWLVGRRPADLALHQYRPRGRNCRRTIRRSLKSPLDMAHTDMLARYDAKNPAALRRLIGAGTQLRRLAGRSWKAAWKAANEHYAELSNTNPRWKKIYEDYARFRDDQIRWSRVTENTFDDFMASVTQVAKPRRTR